MIVSINDVFHRINEMGTESPKIMTYISKPRVYTEKGIFCENNTIDAIRNWQKYYEDTNQAFDQALDLFIELCYNSNKSTINREKEFLIEAANKVRDPMQLMRSIKYKNSRIKRKTTTNIEKRFRGVNDAIAGSIANLSKSITQLRTGGSGGVAKSTDAKLDNPQQEQFIENQLNDIFEQARKIKECDRIVENYNKISKRFNLDKYIADRTTYLSIYETAYDITKLIDSYNMNLKSKYSIALESVRYGLAKRFINCEASDIVDGVTDYFIFNNMINEQFANDIGIVANNHILYKENDFYNINFLYDLITEPKVSIDDIDAEEYINNYGVFTEDMNDDIRHQKQKNKNQMRKNIKQVKSMIKHNVLRTDPQAKKDEEIRQMVISFREKCAKNKDNKGKIPEFKALLTKLFTKTPDQIVNELPSIFTVLSVAFIGGITIAINPILGLLTFITGSILKLKLTRQQTAKILDLYRKELDKTVKKIDKCKNEDEKEKLTKYRDELKKDLEKIKMYDNSNHTDDENDERGIYNYDDDFKTKEEKEKDGGDEWDFDFGDDELETEFNEEALVAASSIIAMSELIERVSEAMVDDNLDGIVCDNIFKLSNDSIDSLTDFSLTVPLILEKDTFKEALEKYRSELRKHGDIETYLRINCINENIYKLEHAVKTYDSYSENMKSAMCYLLCINEIAKMSKSKEFINEMNFTNTLKLAVNNLKRGMLKLSDKEKRVSQGIDVSINNISKGIEQALMNNNREAVIRGRILPSASKCIKIALVIGAAWIISPVIAIIGAIGAFACSQKLKTKERQLVLDDIEIELKMCERYLQQYENKGDLKKVREIEKIKRNLERQSQRIRYKMAVVYDQGDAIKTGYNKED